MRRYVVRDRRTADRSALFGNLMMFGTLAVALVLVSRGGLPTEFSLRPVWIGVPLTLLVLLALLSVVLPLVAMVVSFPTFWFGEIVLVIDSRGLRMPERVPWSEVVEVGIGPVVDAAETVSIRDRGPKVAATVAIRACSPTQTRAYAKPAAAAARLLRGGRLRRDARVAELAAALDAHDRWQAEWSASPQSVGFHVVLDRPFDVDAIRAVTHRYAPAVPVEAVPPLPPASFDTPHRSVARLAALVHAHHRAHEARD